MTVGGERRDAVAQAKDALRRELLAARRALAPEQIAAARTAVARHVMAGLGPAVRTVAAYEPLRTEPGSVELLTALVASGRDVLVPVTLPDRDLDWRPWTPAGPGAPLGLDAVGAADVVLLPALAVARRDGARLGRGGGSYDRALARVRGRTVALLHEGELRDDVPAQAHDRPVRAVVTSSGWFAVGASAAPREAPSADPR